MAIQIEQAKRTKGRDFRFTTGVGDLRSRIMPAEGRRLFTAPVFEAPQEVPFVEAVKRRINTWNTSRNTQWELPPTAKRALKVLATFSDLSYSRQENVFSYFVLRNNSVEVSRVVFGSGLNERAKAADRASGDRRFNAPHRRLILLVQPHVLEVKEMRIRGLKEDDIVQNLALPATKVRQITRLLIIAGEIEPSSKGRYRAQEAREFAFKVYELRLQGIINYDEVARRLGSTKTRVKQVVARLSEMGWIQTLSRLEVGERIRNSEAARSLRKQILHYRLHTDLAIEEIVRVLSESEGRPITEMQVKLQISILIGEGLLQPKKLQERNRNKERLREFLKEYLLNNPNKSVPLAVARRLGMGDDFDYLADLYAEIAKEQPVPRRIRRPKKRQ